MEYLLAEHKRLERNFLQAEAGSAVEAAIYQRLMRITAEIFFYDK